MTESIECPDQRAYTAHEFWKNQGAQIEAMLERVTLAEVIRFESVSEEGFWGIRSGVETRESLEVTFQKEEHPSFGWPARA